MKIKIGRVEIAFLVLLAVYAVFSLLGARALPLFLLKLIVVSLGVAVAIRISRSFVSKSLWHLRNRLIVAYIFIGLVPLVLITTLIGIGVYILAGQMSVYLVRAELERRIEVLHSIAEHIVRNPSHRVDWIQNVGPYLSSAYPNLVIRMATETEWTYPAGTAVPPPPEGWKKSTGLVVKDGLLYGWTHVRSDDVTVTMMFPITHEYLGNLTPGIGAVTALYRDRSVIRLRHLRSQSNKEPTGNRVPPALGWYDIEVISLSDVPAAVWEKPETVGVEYLSVRTRPSALLRRVFFSHQIIVSEDFVAFIFYFVAILFLIAQIFSVRIGMAIMRRITSAVQQLYQGTQRVQTGDFALRIPELGRDQLGELGQSFNVMTGNLERLLVVEKERQRLHAELEIAQEVQNQLYPKVVPNLPTMRITATYEPAQLVSGDYYDYAQLSDTRIAVAMGDVAGKGISAALLMATLVSAFRSQLKMAPKDITPSRLTADLNKHLHAHTASAKFATNFIGIYDEPSSTLTYTNAGHLPPILVRDGAASRLDVNGMIVGAFAFAKYNESSLEMKPGDLLVFFTDGISEPEDEYGEMFGEDRLGDLVVKNNHLPDDQIAQLIVKAARDWSNTDYLQDDMTLLLLRRV